MDMEHAKQLEGAALIVQLFMLKPNEWQLHSHNNQQLDSDLCNYVQLY